MKIDVVEAFPFERPSDTYWDGIEVEYAPLDNLVLESVPKLGVKEFLSLLAALTIPPIMLIELDNRLYVTDGRHRVLIAIARGEMVIRARIYRP